MTTTPPVASPPRPVFGEPLRQILARGEAALSVHTAAGSWRHFGLAKSDPFDRRLVGDLERGDR